MCWAGDDDLDFEELAISIKSVEGENSSSNSSLYISPAYWLWEGGGDFSWRTYCLSRLVQVGWRSCVR